MRFEWDKDKNRQNLRKHDIRFESAVLVFEDPNAITQRDTTHDEEEERFVTLGAATAREGKAYEDANKRAKTGHRRHRRKKEQRHRSF